MREDQDVAARQAGNMRYGDGSSDRAAVQALRPPADVFEDAHGITLQLDMPGVSKEQLAVHMDGNTLTVEGDIRLSMQQGMEALYAEVHSTRYRRSFTLSGELDPDKTEAELKDGVLTLRIPKRSELRPRRIEVRAA